MRLFFTHFRLSAIIQNCKKSGIILPLTNWIFFLLLSDVPDIVLNDELGGL